MSKTVEQATYRRNKRIESFRRMDEQLGPREMRNINCMLQEHLKANPSLKEIRFAVGALMHLRGFSHRDAVICVTSNIMAAGC